MIGADLRTALEALEGVTVRFDADGSRLTSLRVGGPVDALATPAHRQGLGALLGLCREHEVPCRPVGRGFNLLIADEGVDGVLVQLSHFKRIELEEGCLYAEAGVSHATLTSTCRTHGLTGLEFGAGIPGSLGGWIAMNAGIGVRETKDVVQEIEVVAPDGRGPRWLGRDELDFGYRSLRSLAPGSVVVAARLAVERAAPADIAARIDEHLAHRQQTQPLDVPSCGSVFKNPPGGFAGQLLEAAGMKGVAEGAAMISSVHANFIVNTGGATASDVLRLIERAREAVARSSQVELETEVRVLRRAA